jgi:cell division protein FtsL
MAMTSWFRSQRGQINAGCFVALIIVAIVVVVAVKTVPVMIDVGDLQKEIETLAERASLSTYTNKKIHDKIWQKAQELDLPVAPEDIKVKRSSKYIHITVTYTVRIKYPFYTYVWHKVHEVDREVF